MKPIRHFRNLDVSQNALETGLRDDTREKTIAQIVRTIEQPEKWLIRPPKT